MQWEDHGILLSIKKFGETSHILTFFTREFGIHAGLHRGKTKKSFDLGGKFALTWKARLRDHLGEWKKVETIGTSPLIHIMTNSGKLYALSSALALTEGVLADRDPHPLLYDGLGEFLESLNTENFSWLLSYLFYELLLLREIGFGLDLSRCAVTGKTEGLTFVSPKTGHAVTREGGSGYENRLLPLPSFLLLPLSQETLPPLSDLNQGFQLTQYFLEKSLENMAKSQGLKNKASHLPSFRELLVKWIATHIT